MGTLTETNPNAIEFVTEILDDADWWEVLNLVVEFLGTRGVEKVRVEFGFALDRHNAGKQQPPNQIVRLSDLKDFIRTGLREGTIEWRRSSDFVFCPLGMELSFMLCNDADLHFASTDSFLLAQLGRMIRTIGIKVFDSGRPFSG